MGAPRTTDDEFIRVWMKLQSAVDVAKELGMATRAVQGRRASIQKRRGIVLPSQDSRSPYKVTIPEDKIRLGVEMEDGVFVVFSDAHWWPGHISTAHRALCGLLPEIKPNLLIANGDIFDGASISRHPKIGWEQQPTIKQELEAVQERTGELEAACRGSGTKFIRTRGNHCMRFESRLAADAPAFEGVPGMLLDDHLPMWQSCWSVMINEQGRDQVIVKHRWHNGVHATYNNALKGGISIFTGHLHALGVTRFSDYNGTRYGVDTGTLADPWGPQFNYMEDNSRNWRSGFAVGTISDGKLMPPELCEVVGEDRVWFRGNLIDV